MTTEKKVEITAEAVKKPAKVAAPKSETVEPKVKAVKKAETTEVKAEKPAKPAVKKVEVTEVKAEKPVKVAVKKVAELATEVAPAVKAAPEVKVVPEVKAEKPATKKASKTVKAKAENFDATGKRKKSIAKVRLISGSGKITINDRDIEEYFPIDTLKIIVRQLSRSDN